MSNRNNSFSKLVLGLAVVILGLSLSNALTASCTGDLNALNRRQFFRKAGILLGSATIAPILADQLDRIREPDGKAVTYLRTTLEAELLLVGEYMAKRVVEATLKTTTGNAGISKNQTLKINIPFVLEASLLYPVIEEVAFRGLIPGLLGKSWLVGIASNVVFALGHNFYKDENGVRQFATDTIPIQAFIGGVYYWYLMRERGLDHSIIAHGAQNMTVSLAILLYKQWPGQPKP